MFNKIKLVILTFTFFSITAHSQNINDALRLATPGIGSSARAIGMGNSFLALADDASAIYFNPAGLGLIKRMEFMTGLDYFNFENNTTFFGKGSTYSNSSTQLNQLNFVFPFPTMRGSLVFALGYNQTHNFTSALKFDGYNSGNTSMIQTLLNTDIPYYLYLTDSLGATIINGKLNQSGKILQSGSLDNWSFAGAVEVYKNLFVGGTLNLTSGEYDYSRDYYEDDTKGIYDNVELSPGDPFTKDLRTFYLNSILKWEVSGWDFKLGMLYQLDKTARFGASIQFPKSFTVKEKFAVDAMSEFGDGTKKYIEPEDFEDKVEYDIVSPFELSAGGSVSLYGLILSAEATMIDYTQTEFENPVGLTEQFISGLNSDIKDNLRSITNYNLGAEYTFPNIGLRLRGGYFVQPSPYQNDPKDYDKKYLTGGIGFLIDKTISIDLAYTKGYWNEIGDNYGSNVSRTAQDISANKMQISFSYRF